MSISCTHISRHIRHATAGLLLLAVLFLCGKRAWESRHDVYQAFLHAHVSYIGVTLAATLAVSIARSFGPWTALRALGTSIAFFSSVLVTIAAEFGNSFTPVRGGTVLKVAYLKQVHHVSYLKCGGLFAAIGILSVGVSALVADAILLYWQIMDPARASPLILGVGTVFGVGCAAFPWLLRPIQAMAVVRSRSRINVLLDGASFVAQHPRVGRDLLLAAFGVTVASAARLYLCYRLVGAYPSPLLVLALVVCTDVIGLMNLTPGSLGVREAAITFLNDIGGGSAGEGIAVAAVLRGSDYIVQLVLGPLSTMRLAYEMRIASLTGTDHRTALEREEPHAEVSL